jgi:hypothetical protein
VAGARVVVVVVAAVDVVVARVVVVVPPAAVVVVVGRLVVVVARLVVVVGRVVTSGRVVEVRRVVDVVPRVVGSDPAVVVVVARVVAVGPADGDRVVTVVGSSEVVLGLSSERRLSSPEPDGPVLVVTRRCSVSGVFPPLSPPLSLPPAARCPRCASIARENQRLAERVSCSLSGVLSTLDVLTLVWPWRVAACAATIEGPATTASALVDSTTLFMGIGISEPPRHSRGRPPRRECVDPVSTAVFGRLS